MPETQLFLETNEAARLLGVTTVTVRVWVERGLLRPAARTRRIDLFNAEEVERVRRLRQQREQRQHLGV